MAALAHCIGPKDDPWPHGSDGGPLRFGCSAPQARGRPLGPTVGGIRGNAGKHCTGRRSRRLFERGKSSAPPRPQHNRNYDFSCDLSWYSGRFGVRDCVFTDVLAHNQITIYASRDQSRTDGRTHKMLGCRKTFIPLYFRPGGLTYPMPVAQATGL